MAQVIFFDICFEKDPHLNAVEYPKLAKFVEVCAFKVTIN